jgi:hypothetical protein
MSLPAAWRVSFLAFAAFILSACRSDWTPTVDPSGPFILAADSQDGRWSRTEFESWRGRSTGIFDGLAAFTASEDASVRVEGAAGDSRVQSRYVSGNVFRVLRAAIVRGREILPSDEASNTPVVVISENLARRLFPAADPIGRRLDFGGGNLHTIVGVAATSAQAPADLWRVPRRQGDDSMPEISKIWIVIGRLREGLTLDAALPMVQKAGGASVTLQTLAPASR